MAEEARTFEEIMADARAAQGRKEDVVTQQTEPTEEPPAEVPALAETSHVERPKPKSFEQIMAEARGEDPDQNTGVLGDLWTDAKIGGSMVLKGPMIKAETERDFRDITKKYVKEQLSEPDIAGIEKLGGKSIDKMEWFDFDRAATTFYGTEPTTGLERMPEWLRPEKQPRWARMKREMMGFREGDHNEPSGAPAFPKALELLGGSERTAAADTGNLIVGVSGLNPLTPNLQHVYEGIVRPIMESMGINTKEEARAAAEELDNLYLEYTDEQQAQHKKPFINPEATKNPFTWFAGDETKSLSGIFHTTVTQAPMMALMIGASKGGGRFGASRYTRSMKTANNTMEEVQALQKTGARIGGAAAGGAAEMALIRDSVFTEVQGRIENETTDEMWASSADYQVLMDSGLTTEEAKQILAYSYANSAGETAMIISGALLGTPMGAVYGGTIGRSAGREAAKGALLSRMGKHALGEMGQEMGQEATEQIAGNLAVMRINTDVNVFDDVLESMAAAAWTSGAYGALGGINSNKGAGVAKDYDSLVRLAQPWMNAANARYKYANKKGPNTKFSKDSSPQDQLKAMIELERLQEKEASAFDKVRTETRELMEKNGASKEKLLEHDARSQSYRVDLAMIAKRRKSRQIAKRQAIEERKAQSERAVAKAQVERDVFTVSENSRLVEAMQTIQRGEPVSDEMYEELSKMGYGTVDQSGQNYMLTARGVRGLEELAKQAVDLKDKMEGGFTGSDRRVDKNLREAYQTLTEQEFEDQVMRDSDTKLWNKRKWNQDRKDAEKSGRSIASIDADALKWINDNMSHSAGTKALRLIANEIESLGGGAEAYRTGGDEFIVTHPDAERLQSMVELAVSRINGLPRLEEGGKSVKVQVSVGYGEDFDSADLSLQQEKKRRITSGERTDSRVEGATPPSLRLSEPDNSPQMSLFAMSKDYGLFDDDKINDPTTSSSPDFWGEYVQAGDVFYNSQLFGASQVTDEEMVWIEQTIEDFLPSTNSGNPPVTLMHDYTWLQELSPNQYKEMQDMPFGAQNVRGIFSMDDPSHGVFLFADAIIAEVKRGLKYGNHTVSWASLKYRITKGDTVEIIDGDGKIRKAKVTDFTTKKPRWGYGSGINSTTGTEKRLAKLAINSRAKLNKLRRKETALEKSQKIMSLEKREDSNHPVNKALALNYEQQNQAEAAVRAYQSALLTERQKKWNQIDRAAEQDENVKESITVDLDGELLTFNPDTNTLVSSTATEAAPALTKEAMIDAVDTPMNRREFLKLSGAVAVATQVGRGKPSVEEIIDESHAKYGWLKNPVDQQVKKAGYDITDPAIRERIDIRSERNKTTLQEKIAKEVDAINQRWRRARATAKQTGRPIEEVVREMDVGLNKLDHLKASEIDPREAHGDLHIGQLRHAGSTTWTDNLGNEEAAKDEEMTREHVARLVADTVLHETVGHFGIRGITKDYESYIKLTHAMVDAFPEVAANLRAIGYNYRTDINQGEDLDRANKALLGEEIMAWTAGELLSKPDMAGMTLPQQSAIRRFITWFKEQLIQLGWDKYFRTYKAAQIRSARRRMYGSHNAAQREKAFVELYGKGDQQGLVYSSASGTRTGKYQKGKFRKGGKVIKATEGLLNNKDLLNIIARSHDAIINQKAKWTFKDFHGNAHNLYMRDMEIFRKPIYDVMVNGTRKRTEEEVLTEEDLAPAAPIPTLAEAYKEATGNDMPEGWKPLTPGDFKDEAKAQAAAMLEGKTKEEVAQIKKDRLLPNPKMLFDAATAAMSEEEKGLAGKVQSIIGKAKKEVERKANLVKSKKAKIKAGEREFGEAFNQDTIPIFPEVATIQGFVEAAKQALPNAKNKGFISEMEMEAAGFMERVWPSRINKMMTELYATNENTPEFYERIGITKERLQELRQPGTQMTEKEAMSMVEFMNSSNETHTAMGMPDLAFTANELDVKLMQQNSANTLADFVPVMGQYALSQQDAGMSTLNMLLGADHPLTEAYLRALADEMSADPDEREKARLTKMDIMKAPIDVTKVPVPKDWVMDRIKDPVYEVSTSAPIRVPQNWMDHYERLYGEKPTVSRIDDLPQDRAAAIRAELKRDNDEGPDIGYDPVLGKWITVQADATTADYYDSLMPQWMISGSYKGAVFWQRPENRVNTSHFEFAKYRSDRESGESVGNPSGIWGHARYGESSDADPDAPIAPNPDKQGLAMLWHESQADHAQRAAKRHASENAEREHIIQRSEDGHALSQMYRGYLNLYSDALYAELSEEFNARVDRVDDDEVESYMGTNRYAEATDEEKEIIKEAVAASHLYNSSDEMSSIEEFNAVIDNIRSGFDSEPLSRAGRNDQMNQENDNLTESGRIEGEKSKIAFISDARAFEWADHKAMQHIFASLRDLSQQYHHHITDYKDLMPGSDRFKKVQAMGGKIMNLGADNRINASMNSHVEHNAKPDSDNQHGHRLPFMEGLAKDSLTTFFQGFEGGNETAALAKAEAAFDALKDQQSYVVNINLKELADKLGRADITPRTLHSMMNDFRITPFAKHHSVTIKTSNETAKISAYGSKEQMDQFDKEIMDHLRDYMVVRYSEKSMEELENKIYDKKERLGKTWDHKRNRLIHWLADFDVKYAKLNITQDPDAPFVHSNLEHANGISIEAAQQLMSTHDVETFDKYVAREWASLWRNSTTSELDSYIDDGGSEETPTDTWYERYAEQWNERPAAVITMEIPIEWDEDDAVTETSSWVMKRKKVGGRFDIWVDGERTYDGLTLTSVQDKTTVYVRDFYRNKDIYVDPIRFSSLRAEFEAIGEEIKALEKRRDEGHLESGDVFATVFGELEDVNKQRGEFGDMEESFLRVIESHKKSGWQAKELIEKNEQWRVAQILWAFNEAVRNGYARMHLPWGSESGSRGGYGTRKYDAVSYVHSTNEIEYELTRQTIRGQERDILIIKADTLEHPFWVDVTEDTLLPMNPDRQLSDQPEQNEGYFSPQLAKQVGKDVAMVVAQKLSSSKKAAQRNLLMVSKTTWNSDATGGQQQLMESYFVHDTQGNIVDTAASKEEANAIRERLFDNDTAVEDHSPMKGAVSSAEVGGPIQIPTTYYAGAPAYRADYGDSYQHTFARPSYEGGRANYDLVLPARINGHLKRFGLKIEEGYAKVTDHDKMDSMYAGGGRISYNLPSSVNRLYPNVRVDEVSGENFGFIVNSDKGIVLPTVFATKDAAMREMDGWFKSHAVDGTGRVKVYQVTFNDELRKYHSRPQNPFLGVKYQVNGNEKLKAALAKIGSDQPSLLDRFLDWRKTWKASVNIGMFDRFYGILRSLKMTGSSTEGYILTRMSTGIDAIMKGVFEYGSPVWRDGVIVNEGRGLLKILEPVADQIELWAGYMAGVRAKRLMLEGYEKLSASNKAIIDREAGNYEGKNFKEKLFNLLVAVTGDAEKEAVREEVRKAEAEKPEMVTRRTVVKGLGALGVLASVPLPGGSAVEQIAKKFILPHLQIGTVGRLRKAAGRYAEAFPVKGAKTVRDTVKGTPWDFDRIVDPEKAFRNPEQARHSWIKAFMKEEGVTKEAAEKLIDGAIKQAFEEQLTADLAEKAKKKLEKENEVKAEEKVIPEVNRVVSEMISGGREHLFTPTDIEQLIELGDDYPIFKQVSEDYAEFNSKMLDFAQESGVINAETRPLWEEADYIPFYRIADDRLVGPLAKTNGVVNQNSPVKTLKGGKNNLGDLVHNIFMNATKLMDSSVKNHAALKIVDTLEPTGLIRKEKHDFSRELVPMEEIKKVLRRNNIDLDDLEQEVQKGLQTMFAVQAPTGDGVVSVLRNGQKQYYRIDDPLLYRSMAAINMEHLPDWVAPARFAKSGLTTMITLDPAFMAKNFVRDSMSAFVLSRDKFIPLIDGIRGFREAITEGESYRAMVASGSAFESGFINQGDPESTHKYIKGVMKDAGFQRTLCNTHRKLFDAWKRLGSATENANRIAVYQAALKAGKTQQQALYEAKDIMDFSMSGDYKVVQYLISTVPFMGARMQGLHRLGRGAKEHPVAFLTKGTLIGVAGLALWLRYREDDRYKGLEDWDKDAYFHWWIGDQHWRLPKGFEVGAIFNTIPERVFEYYYSRETDAGKHLMRRMGHMFTETFNMNPIPQIAKPLVEGLANYDFFRKHSIESPYEKDVLPEDRYAHYTSETMREMGRLFPQGWSTKWYGSIKSPKQLEHMWAGYTGTIGRYMLNAADIGTRVFLDYPIPPDWDGSDLPVIGSFFRGDRPRRTRYEEEFYRELHSTAMVMNSLRKAEKNDDYDRVDELESFYPEEMLDRGRELQQYSNELQQLNKESREVYTDEDMTRKEKRDEIDEIQRDKNALMKEAYEGRPGAEPKEDEEQTLDTLMDGFDPTSPEGNQEMKVQAPQTSQLFADVGIMSPAQLDKIIRAANDSPREQ